MTDTKQDNPALASDEHMREMRLQRNLKIVVGGLALMILLGLGAVAMRISGLSTDGKPSPVAATAVATPGGEVVLELPQGAKVVSVSLSGNQLAVHHDGPAGAGIAILDLSTGRRITEVKTISAVPRN